MRNLARHTTALLGITMLALFACMLSASCTRTERVDTIRASLVAVHAAQDGFAAWDIRHQQEIVAHASSRDDAQTKIAAYRAGRQTLEDGFAVVYHALATAATQTDDLSLKSALSKAGALIEAIHTFAGDLK